VRNILDYKNIKKIIKENNYFTLIFGCYILSYIFFILNYGLFGLSFFLLSTYFFANYIISLNKKNAVILMLIMFIFFSYLLNYKKGIVLPDIFNMIDFSWYFLAFTDIPLIIICAFNYIFSKKGNLLYILKPNDAEEIKKEDGIIIDIVGFIQAMLLINFSFKNVSLYKYISVVGLIVFIIPRAYAIIKNSSLWRWISTSILLFIMILNSYMLWVESPRVFKIINDVQNIIKIPVDILYILFVVYTITVFSLTVVEMAKYRYLSANDRFYDFNIINYPTE